ncbi:MAG: fibronectin type III domain-containing protein [bacterium]|nr:fibronectin type III domain-containing protein [bacterium]
MRRKKYIYIIVVVSIFIGNDVRAGSINLAPNYSFESDPCVDYFTYPDTCITGGFSWDAQMFRTGKNSLKIVSIKELGTLSQWLNKNEKIPVIAGHKYVVSLWLKTQNVTQHAELNVNFWGPDSQTYINKNGGSSAIITGSNDWTLVSVQVDAPLNAEYLRFEASLYGSGTLWIDDVSVEDLTDITAPILSNIASSNITTNSATITWTTDEPATSQAGYSMDGSFSNTLPSNPTLITTHTMTIPYLVPNTTYNLRVASVDSGGNIAVSLGRTFTTLSLPDTQAPNTISNFSVGSVTQTSMILSWISPVDLPLGGQTASYDIRYSISPITASNWGVASQASGEPTPVIQGINQSYTLPGLLPGTRYYIGIKSQDSAPTPNISALSNIIVQLTLPKLSTVGVGSGNALDKTPPAKPSNLRIFGGPDQILLNWFNPIDVDFVRVVLTKKEGSSPISVTDGTKIYEGKGAEFTDTKIQQGKTYYYAIFAFDQTINYSLPATGSSYLGKSTEAEIITLRAIKPALLSISTPIPLPTNGPTLTQLTTPTTKPQPLLGITITRWLTVGSVGDDVKSLQEFLKQKGYFPQDRAVTNYFGSITRVSLEKFQCAKISVCSGSPGTSGYGATGPRTKAALKNG